MHYKKMVDLEKLRSTSRSTTFAMVSFDGKYEPRIKSFLSIFRKLSPFFRYSIFKASCATFATAPFEGKYLTSYPISDSNGNVCVFQQITVKLVT